MSALAVISALFVVICCLKRKVGSLACNSRFDLFWLQLRHIAEWVTLDHVFVWTHDRHSLSLPKSGEVPNSNNFLNGHDRSHLGLSLRSVIACHVTLVAAMSRCHYGDVADVADVVVCTGCRVTGVFERQ